ncbi:MAG: hypothetical protein ACI8XB_002488, partial [Patiriisocius sp.]
MNISFTRKGIFSHLMAAILCVTSSNIIAQGYVAQNLNSKMNLKQIQTVDLLVSVNDKNTHQNMVPQALVSKAEFFELNDKAIQKLRKKNLDVISVPITLPEVGRIDLNLYRQSIFTSDLTAITILGNDLSSVVNKTMFYRGVVANVEMSIASLTITDGEISGVISIGPNNFNIGKIKDQEAHIIFSEKDLDLANDFICDASELKMNDIHPM